MEKNKLKLSLLIVNGKASKRSHIIEMLSDHGFSRFDQAPNGVEAFQVLKRRPIDFIISGMDMPEMNGLALLKVVSADESLYAIPFLLIAHSMNKDMVLEAGRCGVSAILIEPIKSTVLKKRILEIVEEPGDQKNGKAEILFEEAQKLIEKKDYNKALSLCKEILDKQEDAEVYYNIGYIKTSQKKFDEALVAFRKAVMINNLYARAYKMLGVVYSKKGDTENAQHFLQKAGEIFMERNMDGEAEEAFKEVLRINPDTVNIYNSLGILYRKKRDYKGAIKYYQRAMKIDPDDENIIYNTARSYLEDKQIDQAKKLFEQALSIDPDFKEAKQMLQAIEVGF